MGNLTSESIMLPDSQPGQPACIVSIYRTLDSCMVESHAEAVQVIIAL